MCIIYYNLNKEWRKGNVKKIKEDTVTVLYYIIKTVCLGRPAQFKSVLFKGQLVII